MSFTKFCGSLKQSLIENSKWFQKTSILEENISWWVTCTGLGLVMLMMFLIHLWIRKIRWKKKKREKITVSLEKLKCAKTDSPTCKLYWLIVKYKIYSGLQAGKFQYNKLFICKSSNAYIEHLSLWSTRSAALPHVKLMIIVNSLGFDNWGYSSKSWKFSAT